MSKDGLLEIPDEKLEEMGLSELTGEPAVEEPKEEVTEPVEATEETEATEATVADDATPEMSDVEKQAYEKGWRPDAGPKTADEFLRDEPLYEEIKARGKEIRELKKTLDGLSSHMTKQQEIGYKKAVADLSTQKAEAIRAGDVKAVELIDEQIKEQEALAPNRMDHPTVQSFFDRHKDWLQDPSYEAQKMREFAEKRDVELLNYNLPPEEHVRIIEKDLREEFSSHWDNPNKEAPPAVEAAHSAPKVAVPTYSFKDLTPEEKQVYKYLERTNADSAKSYLKQAIDSRGKDE